VRRPERRQGGESDQHEAREKRHGSASDANSFPR
jgi:hypothetical protein